MSDNRFAGLQKQMGKAKDTGIITRKDTPIDTPKRTRTRKPEGALFLSNNTKRTVYINNDLIDNWNKLGWGEKHELLNRALRKELSKRFKNKKEPE